MALDDFKGEPVEGGTWLYGGVTPKRVLIVACNFDQHHAWELDAREYDDWGDEQLSPPRPMGPDGVLYYVRDVTSPGYETIDEARAWVDAQPWGPVAWDFLRG